MELSIIAQNGNGFFIKVLTKITRKNRLLNTKIYDINIEKKELKNRKTHS